MNCVRALFMKISCQITVLNAFGYYIASTLYEDYSNVIFLENQCDQPCRIRQLGLHSYNNLCQYRL